jgi:uncharacterized protein (TIGR03435 family)
MSRLRFLLVAIVLFPASLLSSQPVSAPPSAAGSDSIALDTPWSPPTPGAAPEFEVATVKPSDPNACCSRTFGRTGRRFRTTNTNLKYLIQWAWNLQAKQVAGGPTWMDAARFDLAGEMGGTGAPNDHEWKLAVQKLLVERFQLKIHHEQQEMPAFALTIERGGPKLTPGDGKVNEHQSMGFSGAVGESMHGYGRNASIADFIGELQRIVLDRPIVDQTGLAGVYDIQFEFTREDPNALGMAQLPDNAAPNLLTALEQQLGLKLHGEKAGVDVMVVDHAELPSAN